MTNYTHPSITLPQAIAAGPDGALWFTNHGTTRSGGSPRPGRSPTTPAPASTADQDRGRARRRPVVHQHWRQLDRADHHHRDGHQLHRPRHQRPVRDRGRARRRPVVHQHGNNSIGRITTTGTVTNYTDTGITQPGRDRGRARRCVVVHQLGQQLDRADHDGRGRHQLHRPQHQLPDGDRGRARRRPVVHQLGNSTRSGGSPRPGRSPTTPAPASTARTGSRPGPTAPCGSPTRQQLDRADHHRPGPSRTTPTPASPPPSGSRPGPTAPCGSPTRATTRSGGSRRGIRRSWSCRARRGGRRELGNHRPAGAGDAVEPVDPDGHGAVDDEVLGGGAGGSGRSGDRFHGGERDGDVRAG